jgi:hypothetical protein
MEIKPFICLPATHVPWGATGFPHTAIAEEERDEKLLIVAVFAAFAVSTASAQNGPVAATCKGRYRDILRRQGAWQP